jgi:bis(5'-nucleosidyl)-tetraphosphatase
MARNERSAGVVVFYDDPGGRLFLLLDYGRHWDFPKGHVEKDEDDRTAALRELEEETGLTDVLLNETFAHEITYYFRDRHTKVLIRKTVVFFLCETRLKKVTLSHEHVGYIYLPFAEAVKKLTFPAARQVMRLAGKHLEKSAT